MVFIAYQNFFFMIFNVFCAPQKSNVVNNVQSINSLYVQVSSSSNMYICMWNCEIICIYVWLHVHITWIRGVSCGFIILWKKYFNIAIISITSPKLVCRKAKLISMRDVYTKTYGLKIQNKYKKLLRIVPKNDYVDNTYHILLY